MFHSDKHYQLRFTDGSNKSKMADGWDLEKSKNGHISITIWPTPTKFDTLSHIDPTETVSAIKNLNF